MKQKFFIICLTTLLVLFSACNPNVNDSVDKPDAEKPLTVPVPVFGSTVAGYSQGRGITQMPLDEFNGVSQNDKLFLANKIMTTMPTMTSITPVEIDITKNNFGINVDYSVYGFKIALNPFSSSINKDGIYLNYDIYESKNSDTKVGFANYYYNIIDKKFTYRQAVVVTLEIPQIKNTINLLIVLEYKDVDYDIFSNEFSVGQLTEEGTLDDNAICDIFRLGDTTNSYDGIESSVGNIYLSRRHITMQAKDGRIASFNQPDYEFKSQQIDWRTFPLNEIMEQIEGNNGDYTINTDKERANANKDFALSLISKVYKAGNRLAQNNIPYKTYQDFIERSIKELNLFKLEKLSTHICIDPTIYDVETKEGASTLASDNVSSIGNSGNVLQDYKNCNFENFYPIDDKTKKQYDEYSGDGNRNEIIWNFLVDKHLRACGITNEEYIEAFKKVACGTQIESSEYPERIRIE